MSGVHVAAVRAIMPDMPDCYPSAIACLKSFDAFVLHVTEAWERFGGDIMYSGDITENLWLWVVNVALVCFVVPEIRDTLYTLKCEVSNAGDMDLFRLYGGDLYGRDFLTPGFRFLRRVFPQIFSHDYREDYIRLQPDLWQQFAVWRTVKKLRGARNSNADLTSFGAQGLPDLDRLKIALQRQLWEAAVLCRMSTDSSMNQFLSWAVIEGNVPTSITQWVPIPQYFQCEPEFFRIETDITAIRLTERLKRFHNSGVL